MKKWTAPRESWLVRVVTRFAQHELAVTENGFIVVTQQLGEDVYTACDTLEEAREELEELVARDISRSLQPDEARSQ